MSLCVCRNVEPVAALEPVQRHLWGRNPGALPRMPQLLAGKTRLRWIAEGDFPVLAGGVCVYVALLSSSPGAATALAKAKCKMETSHLSFSHTDLGGCHIPVVDGVGQEPLHI